MRLLRFGVLFLFLSLPAIYRKCNFKVTTITFKLCTLGNIFASLDSNWVQNLYVFSFRKLQTKIGRKNIKQFEKL